MATILAALPTEILAQILPPSHSPSVLNLWLTGNRLIQYRIANGITAVHLSYPAEHSLNMFPKFLQNLRVLRELKVDRGGNALLSYRDARFSLQYLPQSIRKLELGFRNSFEFVFPSALSPSDLTSGYDPNWSLANAFPLLEVLELYNKPSWSAADFAQLPPTLTSLATTLPLSGKFKPHLPASLLYLKILDPINQFPGFADSLPPKLVSLELASYMAYNPDHSTYDAFNVLFPKLPCSLTSLCPGFERIRYSTISLLPSTLTTLICRSWEHVNINLGQCFPNLKTLDCICTVSAIRQLPPTLTQLSLSTIKTDQELPALPSSLTDLKIVRPPRGLLNALPPTLRHLRALATQIDLVDVAKLPRSLLSLEMEFGYKHNTDRPLDFPPGLTSLHLTSFYQWLEVETPDSEDRPDWTLACPPAGSKLHKWFPCEKIPRSVTQLRLEGYLPASHLKHLPPRLTELRYKQIFEDADFNPSDLEAMRDIFEIGAKDGIRETFDWTALKKASIFSLLPRTLKTLHMDVLSLKDLKSELGQLPPGLEDLSFGTFVALPASAVFSLPLTRLKKLRVKLGAPTDAHLKAFPRSLELTLLIVHETHLTTASARYLPPPSSVAFLSTNRTLRPAFEALQQARKDHCMDEDTTVFRSLMSLEGAGDIIEKYLAKIRVVPDDDFDPPDGIGLSFGDGDE